MPATAPVDKGDGSSAKKRMSAGFQAAGMRFLRGAAHEFEFILQHPGSAFF